MRFPKWVIDDSDYRLDPNHQWPDGFPINQLPNWHARESSRFHADRDDGKPAYTPLPWHWSDLPSMVFGHFPHLSLSNGGKIAFTASFAHGVADRQTAMRPGRYLQKYYPELSGPQIARLSDMIGTLQKSLTLSFARTREEIREVYLNGPNSCMAKSAYTFATNGVHPTEVYAGPDTAIAYLTNDGGVSARAVVRLDADGKPCAWLRSFGDRLRLEAALDAAGIEQDDRCLHGARLLAIKVEGDSLVCPYIDNGSTAEDGAAYVNIDAESGYLVVDCDDGYYLANDYTRCTTITTEPCPICGARTPSMSYVEGEGDVCNVCVDRDYVPAQRRDGFGFTSHVLIRHSLVGVTYFECAETGRLYARDLCVQVIYPHNFCTGGEHIAVWVAEAHIPSGYRQCATSGMFFHRGNMVRRDGAWVANCAQQQLELAP